MAPKRASEGVSSDRPGWLATTLWRIDIQWLLYNRLLRIFTPTIFDRLVIRP